MRQFISFAILLPSLFLGSFTSSVFSQDAEQPEKKKEEAKPVIEVSDRVIEQSRHKGMDYLKSQQQEDGSWEFDGHQVGITALCTLALLENGVPETDPIIEKGMRYLRKNTKELTSTYDLALTVLLLSRTGNKSDKKLIRNLSARLVAGQCTSGGWTYSCPKVSSLIFSNPKLRPKPTKSPGDNSCTQFAVLGLWAASRSGIKIDDSMRNVALRFLKTQNEDGGWGYRVPKDLNIFSVEGDEKEKPRVAPNAGDLQPQQSSAEPSKNSMTFAALFCLTVSRATRIREGKSGTTETEAEKDEAKTLMEDPVFKKGLKKAGDWVKAGSGVRYYLWSTERLGVLLGQDTFGGVNWFDKGASYLINSQNSDNGAWESETKTLSDTSFAILFLRKANLGSDISRLLEGDPVKKFQIVSQKGKPRFHTLKLAVAASKENDVIRIDGNGPFKLPHILVDHSLNIQAGFGYEPQMKYDIGYNEKGVRNDPARDVESRYLFKVNKGTLTIEGLRMEMDPPNIGRTSVIWNGIRVNGGNLKLLNCRISETNRKGTAAILLEKPGLVYVKNSMLIGGRACIEVEGNGKQEVDIDNSILFSNAAIQFVGKSGNDKPEVTVALNKITLQCKEGFPMKKFDGSIAFNSTNSLYKVKDLGSSMLKSGYKKTGRSWSGEGNIYDTSKWIGANGKSYSSVRDARSWSKFWGKKDIKPIKKTIGCSTRRRAGSYSHNVKSEDWDLKEFTSLAVMRPARGIRSGMVGSGFGFSRFRDSILYNQWKKGELKLSSADK